MWSASSAALAGIIPFAISELAISSACSVIKISGELYNIEVRLPCSFLRSGFGVASKHHGISVAFWAGGQNRSSGGNNKKLRGAALLRGVPIERSIRSLHGVNVYLLIALLECFDGK